MATITQNQFRSEFKPSNSENIDLMKSTVDTINTKTGEISATPTANTILGRLKEIADNTAGATITTNFTVTNSANVDLMKASTDIMATDIASLDTKAGEVSATPTANTILGRLKDIADNTAGGVTTNFTTTNSANLDLMKVSNDNILTKATSLDTKVGEVQATPTANTVLGRLKEIADNTAGAVTTNFTTVNSTNLDLMKVSNDNIKTNTDAISSDTSSLDTKVGEVQAIPTANTILGRLKEIADNTSAGVTTNFTTVNSTNLDLMKASTDTLVTNSNSMSTKVGEVSATPTANTILGRLKDIADNTAGGTITTNFTTTNSTNLDLMKVSNDNILTNTASLDTKVGEVQATPTANTILGRLKEIADNTAGATITTNFTTTNSANVDAMKASTDTLVTNSNLLDTKVGEVSATPTANTILARLKDIADNTAGGVTTNFTVTNSTNLDLMKVSNDNIKTNTDTLVTNSNSLDTKVGEVQATPTANTILGRLKEIADNTAGATITTNFTTTNSSNLDLMKASTDTMVIDIASLDTKVGEVSTTPTANTILARLKEIADNTAGATITTNFTTTNSTNLDLMKTSTDTLVTNSNSLDTKVGEVQATPTANTILGRLKEIADNTAGATITTNFTTTNSSNLDLMKVSNDNIKTNTDSISSSATSLDTKVGEVQAIPTANTILGRLKEIADNTAGATITTNFTTTNSTNLDLMKASTDTLVTNSNSLDAKVGEVQATPTANTILARLKDIADNTAGGVTTNFTTTNSTNLDLMKVSNDNIKTNTDSISSSATSLDTKVGEVSATPTANTILARLKEIADNTAGGVTTNFTVTNSTNLDLMKVSNDNIKTNTDTLVTNSNSLDTKVGEVQATPTANTILGRLKDIADNTAGGVTTNFTTTNSSNLDLMKVGTDTLVTNSNSLDTKVGEVSATPTANTILARLKDIADNTAGATITTNFTTTNSSNVDLMKATIDTLNTKVGEVQETPTANTVLARLKEIVDNTSGGGSSVTVANTSTNQVYTRVLEFEVSTEITRSANTTAYATNQIINNSGASVLPALDFSGIGSLANRAIQINSITLISSNGSVATKLTPIIHLFNADSITGQTLTDATTFNPSYAEVIAKRTMTFEGLSLRVNHGSGFYLLTQIEILRNAILDANSKLYVALITSGAYTPASGEKFTIMIKGYLL